jgi:hypothetical protein
MLWKKSPIYSATKLNILQYIFIDTGSQSVIWNEKLD